MEVLLIFLRTATTTMVRTESCNYEIFTNTREGIHEEMLVREPHPALEGQLFHKRKADMIRVER
jgi:hypothetical protein